MKKQTGLIFLCVICIFIGFLFGFLTGRNYNHTDVQISNLERSTATITAAQIQSLADPSPTAALPATEIATVPVPTEATVPTTQAPTIPETQASDLVNINTANLAQLVTLPGIGEVIGQRIIDYREANGPFVNIAQITNVSGIGEKRFAAIADLITVG